ncbi:hypothetical protein [Oribacterium sp. P6A1]|uniref:hypothetical protein n=1 Tax=Oribacterium sp. P6A1 TaxID=1410612 RepID=UPI00056D35AA|nr:hypothetical protein [Oribacterium sp. P6A1]
MNQKLKKKIILNIPYVAIGLFATNLGEAWRIADGINASARWSNTKKGCQNPCTAWTCCIFAISCWESRFRH